MSIASQFTILGALVFAMSCNLAFAETIIVAKDGSGDALTIPIGISLAASGDTVLVRPGRYLERTPVETPSGDFDVFGISQYESLSIIGSSADSVVVGDETSDGGGPRTIGFLSLTGSTLNVSGVGFENVTTAIEILGGGQVENVRAQTYGSGVVASFVTDLVVRDCQFISLRPRDNDFGVAVYVSEPGGSALIERVTCDGYGYGGFVSSGENVVFRNCRFINGGEGIQLQGLSIATRMESCEFRGNSQNNVVALEVTGTEFVSCFLGAAQRGLHAQGSDIHVSNSVIEQASLTTFFLGGAYPVIVENSNIRLDPSNPESLYLFIYRDSPVVELDMRGNYWSGMDSTAIANSIWDINDDASINARVLFSPMSETPVSASSNSIGSMKSRFLDPEN